MRKAIWVVLCAIGCGGGATTETGSAPVDSGTELPPDTGLCATAPVTTYDNFGRGFLKESCQPCHASTSADRHDAPEEIHFDDEAQAWALADRILERATGAEPTMPPAGGVSEDDRYLLEVWFSCDAAP